MTVSNTIPVGTGTIEYTIQDLPNEILEEIFSHLEHLELRDVRLLVARVCKRFNEVINTGGFQKLWVKKQKYIFGKEMWEKYIGSVGIEPPLPPDIYKILISPSLFNPGQRVCDDHILTMIPKTVGKIPLTLKTLGDFVKAPKEGFPTQYNPDSTVEEILNEHNKPVDQPCWVLLTKDVIRGSRDKPYSEQEQLLELLSTRANVPCYGVPPLLETAISIFMYYIRTGTEIYSKATDTFTHCLGRISKYPDRCLVIGGHRPITSEYGVLYSGLSLNVRACALPSTGMGAFRKF